MTDTSNTNDTAPTQPLPETPAVEPASVPTIEAGAHVEREHWRPSTGGIVAMAVAGALMLSTIAFGAGWGAHGLAQRLDGRGGYAMMQYRNGQAQQFGRQTEQGQRFGGRGDCPMGDQNSDQFGGYGRGRGQGGWGSQDAPQSNSYPQQDGWNGQGDPHAGLPGFSQ